jgi:hypothetical protein
MRFVSICCLLLLATQSAAQAPAVPAPAKTPASKSVSSLNTSNQSGAEPARFTHEQCRKLQERAQEHPALKETHEYKQCVQTLATPEPEPKKTNTVIGDSSPKAKKTERVISGDTVSRDAPAKLGRGVSAGDATPRGATTR